MNKYEIIGIVGEGAYGIVYKAKCKETGEFGKEPFHNSQTQIAPTKSHNILLYTSWNQKVQGAG